MRDWKFFTRDARPLLIPASADWPASGRVLSQVAGPSRLLLETPRGGGAFTAELCDLREVRTREEAAKRLLLSHMAAMGGPVVARVHERVPADVVEIACAVGVAVISGNSPEDEQWLGPIVTSAFERLQRLAARVTVAICMKNSEEDIGALLHSLQAQAAQPCEVLVYDDGSTDASRSVVESLGFTIAGSESVGLGAARNALIELARGDFVAFIDADAVAAPHWLMYIAGTLFATGADAVGGINLPVATNQLQESATSCSPCSSLPIVRQDGVALHLPGCNVTYKRASLQEIGGFAEQLRAGAYDDVDANLRLRAAGHRLVLAPCATTFHHRRRTVSAYLRQIWRDGRGASAVAQALDVEVARHRLAQRERWWDGAQAKQLWVCAEGPSELGEPARRAGHAALAVVVLSGLPSRVRGLLLVAVSAMLCEDVRRVPAEHLGYRVGLRVRLLAYALYVVRPFVARGAAFASKLDSSS